MAKLKYSYRIITTARQFPQEVQEKMETDLKLRYSTLESTHLLSVDSNILPDFFWVDCNWIWSGSLSSPLDPAHFHDFDEVYGFIGSNRDDPYDLGGEIIIWLDGHKEILTRSCLIFVPAGVVHGPIFFNRVDKPIFFVSISPSKTYTRTNVDFDINTPEPEKPAIPKCTIVTKTKERFTVAASGGDTPPTQKLNPNLKSTRILHLEDDIAKGSFYVDFVWIWEGNGAAPAPIHNHEWPELIAMVGADPEHPRDMGGPMSIVLGDETHVLEKSCLVCIPKSLDHCPWKFLDIKKPTLVFTAGPSGMYTGSHKED
jgi:hypothetical protein